MQGDSCRRLVAGRVPLAGLGTPLAHSVRPSPLKGGRRKGRNAVSDSDPGGRTFGCLGSDLTSLIDLAVRQWV